MASKTALDAPWSPQDGVRRATKALRRPKRPPRSPRTPPACPRRPPRGLQEASRKLPAGPKSAPRGSKKPISPPPTLALPIPLFVLIFPHMFPEGFPNIFGEHMADSLADLWPQHSATSAFPKRQGAAVIRRERLVQILNVHNLWHDVFALRNARGLPGRTSMIFLKHMCGFCIPKKVFLSPQEHMALAST
eukprot:3749053-Pyramimonas_sp.AAC.1